MACWTYEGILLFGVVFLAGYLFGTLSQTRNAMDNRHPLQAFLFLIFGIYFAWFWSKGQTLAMKTGTFDWLMRAACLQADTCLVALRVELGVVLAAAAGGFRFFTQRRRNHSTHLGLGRGLGNAGPLPARRPVLA